MCGYLSTFQVHTNKSKCLVGLVSEKGKDMYSLDAFTNSHVHQCADYDNLIGHYKTKLKFICSIEQRMKQNTKRTLVVTIFTLIVLCLLVCVALYIFFCGRRDQVEDAVSDSEADEVMVSKAKLI